MKKTDDALGTIAFIVVMGTAVALAIANDIVAPACKAATQQVTNEKFDFGCLEFWFNRYQSLLGNIITATVAGAALFWAAGQLIAANKQVEAANRQAAVAAAQAMRSVAEDYQIIREKLEKFGEGIGRWLEIVDLTKPYAAVSMHQNLASRASKIVDSAVEVLLPLEAVHLRTGAGEFYDLTNELSKSSAQILKLAGEARLCAGAGDIHNAIARLGSVKVECRNCIDRNNVGLTLVRMRMKETWIAIQSLQQRAFGL